MKRVLQASNQLHCSKKQQIYHDSGSLLSSTTCNQSTRAVNMTCARSFSLQQYQNKLSSTTTTTARIIKSPTLWKISQRHMGIASATATMTSDEQKDQSSIETRLKNKIVNMKGVKNNGTTIKFYKTVNVVAAASNEWYVTLSDRVVLTPAGKKLQVPSYLLACALAAEWAAQTDRIRPTSMPLNHIVVTAIDQVPSIREDMISSFRTAAAFDSICYRAAAPRRLIRLQEKYWDPLLSWLKDTHHVQLRTTTAVSPVEQDESSLDRVANYIASQNDIRLSALDTACSVTKSAAISMALAEHLLTVEDAWNAARVDENYNIKEWGKVEGAFGHGVEMEFTRLKLAAAKTVFNLLP